jgi:hypothetical protein
MIAPALHLPLLAPGALEADPKVAERLAWRAASKGGSVEVALTGRRRGPGTEAGELCVPASAVRVHVEDHGVVSHALECDKERTGACPTPQGRALRVESPAPGGRSRGAGGPGGQGPAAACPAVHVFFDGSDLRFWSGVGPGGRSPSASIPAGPCAP